MRHISGILRELAESAGFLPKIKKSDEGKTLVVQNGMPVWASGATGSAAVVNVYRVDPTDEYSDLALDKTWNEIKTYVDNGVPVILHEDMSASNAGNYYISIGLLYSIAGGDYYSIACALDSEGWYGIKMFYADTPDSYPQST